MSLIHFDKDADPDLVTACLSENGYAIVDELASAELMDRVAAEMGRVQGVQQVELILSPGRGKIRRPGEMSDRRSRGAEGRALVDRGQEPRGPVPGAIHRQSTRVRQDDIRGQILPNCPQSVQHPRPPDRSAREDFA